MSEVFEIDLTFDKNICNRLHSTFKMQVLFVPFVFLLFRFRYLFTHVTLNSLRIEILMLKLNLTDLCTQNKRVKLKMETTLH